jgi:hypothetical protein
VQKINEAKLKRGSAIAREDGDKRSSSHLHITSELNKPKRLDSSYIERGERCVFKNGGARCINQRAPR